MSQFSILLKKEIGRIAKKEVRAEVAPVKKSNSQARSEIAALKKRVARLEALIKRVSSSTGRSRSSAVEAEAADSPKLRFRAGGFATLRKKLNLSAHEMAQLLGVSAQSVYHWETGKSKPQARQLAAIAAVRKLGKKEVAARLSGAAAS
jgi:DNA-binding transcriptional regulator YiaG